ncbi:7564_t:CDS:2, partial [Racocetra fulgida]
MANNEEAPQLNDDLAVVSLDDDLAAVSLDDDLAAVSLNYDLAAVSLDDDLVTVSLDDELVVAKKLYKGRIFQSWDEAYDTIKLYARQKGFGLKKGHIEKTSDEFYMNVVKLKPLQIQRAIQKEFPDREIYLFEIHKLPSSSLTLPQILFSELDTSLSKFLTPTMLEVQ